MSSSSIEVMQKVDIAIQQDNMPEWLDNFLGKKFFDKCPAHDSDKKDLNRYCITCDASTCRDCVSSGHHRDHELLTIHRHVYQNVVPLNQMKNYMDCTKIQHYKCNKKWVVSLTPLPHNGSGAHIIGDGACLACKRKLTDSARFYFCSIVCKVEAMCERNRKIQPGVSKESTSGKGEVEQSVNYRGRKRSRKGVPHRAPLF